MSAASMTDSALISLSLVLHFFSSHKQSLSLISLSLSQSCDNTIQPQEIIEFPACLLNLATLEIDSEFQSYVKPEIHPVLTPFCTNLTGTNVYPPLLPYSNLLLSYV